MCKCNEHKESDFTSVLVGEEHSLMKSIPHNDLRTYAQVDDSINQDYVRHSFSRHKLRKKLENLMKRNDLNKKSFLHTNFISLTLIYLKAFRMNKKKNELSLLTLSLSL